MREAQTISRLLSTAKQLTETLSKNLYQFILRAPSSELYFEDVSAEPALTVEIVTKDGGGDFIEFIPVGNRQAVVRLNGESKYRCQQSYVDRFIKNLELYENGQEIVINW